MGKRVLLLLHDGFEEIEAIVPLDILRRGSVEVTCVSATGSDVVVSAHGLRVTCDAVLSTYKEFSSFDALIVPGGPGVFAIVDNSEILDCVRSFNDKVIAMICAAPLLLKRIDMLPIRYTAHPCVGDELVNIKPERVVVCDNVITACGPGASAEFAFNFLQKLTSDEKLVNSLKETMFFK